MLSPRRAQPTGQRSPLKVICTAACLVLLPALAWAQALRPCPSELQARVVANTNDTAALAISLQCSNGSFAVKWFGDVVVSQTIHITQGTSLNVTGASADATANGNHVTQLFAVNGTSHLHLADMVLANGDAEFGGAIHAMDQASVSFGGITTFTSSTASYGGAMYAGRSTTVIWGGEETTFIDNNASHYGGAIMADGSSSLSWDGMTVFVNNSATHGGGAVYLGESSGASWSSQTLFTNNTAGFGGAMYVESSTVTWDGGDTTFVNNEALYSGGALMAMGSSSVSWKGETRFGNNSAGYVGGAILANGSSSLAWGSRTSFTDNTARSGGAIYANSSYVSWDGIGTVFRKNNASGYTNESGLGGAIMANRASSISWDGETVFMNNEAEGYGGAVFLNNFSNGSWKGVTDFVTNSAVHGGGVMVYWSSSVSWEGETAFTDNIASFWGGGLYLIWSSTVSWTGNTTFRNNSAHAAGGVMIYGDSVGAWAGTTTFVGNTVTGEGAALDVHERSNASWTGVTTFTDNIANRAGAIFLWKADVSWTGNTTFAGNVAHLDGGAVYATVNTQISCQGTTTFRNNTATTGNGGALGIYGYLSNEGSYVNISGEATFADNAAFAHGGAIFSSANTVGQRFEGVAFLSNSAAIGGAVATFGTGNGNELAAEPTMFSRCQFINNTATETGGAVETAFGQAGFVSSDFVGNFADVGGALRLGGVATVSECSFISNKASSSGLAISAVGSVEINGSSFHGNVFSCEEGEFREDVLQEGSNTARYDTVCVGCPTWVECYNCTVRDSNLDPTCTNALQHTSANEAGSTLESLRVESGYWRATARSSIILACYNNAACLGGQTGTETFCDDGYTGPYCSVCQGGYSPSLSATCTRCSPSRRQWLMAITAVAAAIVVCAMVGFAVYLVTTNFDNHGGGTFIPHPILQRVPLQAFKCVVVVWQILTQFASVANVTYPGAYQTFLSALNILNLDIGFIVSAGCLWSGIDFHDRFIADTIWPLGVLGLLAMTYQVALHRSSTGDDGVREKIRNKHVSAVLFLLFFVYSSVSSTVFRMFACDNLDDGEEYLRADYRILCTGAKHRALQTYAAIMIVVYPVGIPLLFVVLLYRHRDVLSGSGADKAAAKSIASLWTPYRPSCFYYEVVECGRRIMLTGVVVFIYPNDTAQIAITIIMSFFFFVASEVMSPYQSKSDTWLSRSGHIIIFFTMFDVLLLRVDVSQESSESQRILAGVFVAGHAAMVAAVVGEAIVLWYASSREGEYAIKDTRSRKVIRRPAMPFNEEEEADFEEL